LLVAIVNIGPECSGPGWFQGRQLRAGWFRVTSCRAGFSIVNIGPAGSKVASCGPGWFRVTRERLLLVRHREHRAGMQRAGLVPRSPSFGPGWFRVTRERLLLVAIVNIGPECIGPGWFRVTRERRAGSSS
jgi:hypothetical protein